ncbi:hypothetical protein BpHYR1_033518 [Brachionus plicatilis]|uniref:Uncharacterized protein n=1 Tax=Brachionus plicatilis TaxID=10195 RepID=A0A3M7PDG3_BRAPC|nr:hypothetical protein BpHYR1_033518 [Brachionus plicatilis]
MISHFMKILLLEDSVETRIETLTDDKYQTCIKVRRKNHDFELFQKYENYSANIFNITIIPSPDLHLTRDLYNSG